MNYCHGDGGRGTTRTRLYRCWADMKTRARKRDNCEVHPSWVNYATFKEWAISSGYEENLVLCRTKDTGNYEPSNVRWDSISSNMKEANSKHYKLTLNGELVEVYNLESYCKENNLDASSLRKVHSGKRNKHKGYTKW